MTRRETIKTLLEKKIPERVGLNESFWPFIRENGWEEQGVPAVDFVEYFNLDIRSVGGMGIGDPRPDLARVVEESDEWIVRANGWGSITKTWKAKAGTPEHIGNTINSVDIWKNDFRDAVLALKPEDAIDIEGLKTNLANAEKEDRFTTYNSLFIFEMLRAVLGDVFMLESLLLEQDFIHDFNSILTDKYIAVFEYAFKEAGLPDGMHIYEDLGYTASAFASPQCHRDLVYPYHKKLFDFFKDYNLPIILHTCGDFRVHLDSIVESGADCIQAMEAKTGMNVVEMAKEYKDKLCFMGNLDIMAFESGDRESIKDEVLGKLNGMKELKAPYVFMSDHSVPPSVTVDDYKYALDLYWENCKY